MRRLITPPSWSSVMMKEKEREKKREKRREPRATMTHGMCPSAISVWLKMWLYHNLFGKKRLCFFSCPQWAAEVPGSCPCNLSFSSLGQWWRQPPHPSLYCWQWSPTPLQQARMGRGGRQWLGGPGSTIQLPGSMLKSNMVLPRQDIFELCKDVKCRFTTQDNWCILLSKILFVGRDVLVYVCYC